MFGSVARGGARPDSDIDFLVEFQPRKKSFDTFMGLSCLLEDLFGENIELVTRESLSPFIGPNILREVEYADLRTSYLRHMLVEVTYLANEAEKIDKHRFLEDETLKRAFVRSIEIIGDASKLIPDDTRSKAP